MEINKEPIARAYARRVAAQKIKIENVPSDLRELVRRILDEQNN